MLKSQLNLKKSLFKTKKADFQLTGVIGIVTEYHLFILKLKKYQLL